jgi:hypothetical protein
MWNRAWSASGAAALLLAGVMVSSAAAKPPDLPVSYHDTFTPYAEVVAQEPNNYELPPPDPELPIPLGMPRYEDSGLYFLGGEYLKSDDNGITVHFSRDQECGSVVSVMQRIWNALTSILNGTYEAQEGTAGASEEAENDSTDQSTCPATTTEQPSQECPEASSGSCQDVDSTVDVAKMLTARRIFQIAERCLNKGDLDMASSCFQEVHLLAPTSRYGQRAIERLSQIESRKAQTGDAEEQDQQQTQPSDLNKLNAAREMYHIGQRCLQAGDLDMAFNCFHETKLICPGSRYAHLAVRGLRQIEALRTTDEAAEPDDGQETPSSEPQDQATCPMPGPIAKPVKKKKLKGIRRVLGGTGADKPRFDIIEGSSGTAAIPVSTQSTCEEEAAKDHLLYVSPPARRLTIKQEYPKPSDE